MQELEKILEEIDQEVKEYMEIDFGDEYNAGIKDMAKMSKKIIRKHMNDSWIPVEERMPENDDFVLATVTGIYNVLTFSEAIQLASYCKDDGWFIEGYPEWENPNVSAWRPLPEPYRPERCGEE